MKILIYDTEHFETIEALVTILHDGINEIHVFINADHKDEFAQLRECNPDVQWIENKDNPIHDTHILYRYCKSRSIDTIILNTVSRHHLLFTMACKLLVCKMIMTVHDINGTFQPKGGKDLRSFIRSIGKKYAMKAASGYFVYLSSMKDYILKNELTKKPVVVVPGALPKNIKQQQLQAPTDKRLKIALAGSISKDRRNYDDLVKILPLMEGYTVDFIFAGAVHSDFAKNLVAECIRKKPASVNIHYIEDKFVPFNLYNDLLSQSDLIYAPLIQAMDSEGVKEFYGLTKSSGVFFDAVRWNKPLIVPGHLTIPGELSGQTIVYNDPDHLISIINKFVFDESYKKEWKEKALSNKNKFSVEKIRNDVRSMITVITNE